MSLDLTDAEVVTRLTNEAIPLDAGQTIRVNAITDVGSWQHGTITYETIWPDGATLALMLRTYRSPFTVWQTDDAFKRDREWAILRRLRLDGFPAPRPLASGQSGDQPFIIWQAPPGEAGYRPEEDFHTQARPMIPQLAELLTRLHTLNHHSLNNEPLYEATVAGTLVRMLIWSRQIGDQGIRQVIARLKPAVAQIHGWRHRLIHGNAHLGNLRVDEEKRITALMNWDQAAIGDPRWDVMTAAHWLRQHDPTLAEQLVNWYETFSGKTIDKRPFWWAMISARLWAVKAWAAYAIEQGLLPQEPFAAWVADREAVRTRTLTELDQAGL